MSKLEDYVRQHLDTELRNSKTKSVLSANLTIYERTIIYKYTDDGYESLNEHLRKNKGLKNIGFGRYLRTSLSKLPSFSGIVYRGANLTTSEFDRYKRHLKSGAPLKEYSFVSASKSRLTAMAFGAQYLFRIWSKKGKSVEEFAKFGIGNSQNEFEVLFTNNSKYKVTEIRRENNYTLITMFEI